MSSTEDLTVDWFFETFRKMDHAAQEQVLRVFAADFVAKKKAAARPSVCTAGKKRKAGDVAGPSAAAQRKRAAEPAASQSAATEGAQAMVRPAYAAVVAGSSSGPSKPTANGSLEPAVNTAAAGRTSSTEEVSGPLEGTPSGTTVGAQLPPGMRRANTPIFISGIKETKDFLIWLRARTPGGLTAQSRGERLMVVPCTADGFRAAVGALRSLDEKGVTFHTYSLPEDRCVRLLVKNLGRQMPESVVREELGALGIKYQAVLQLRSARREQSREVKLAFAHPSYSLESVNEPSKAVNAGMATQTEGRACFTVCPAFS